jgi:hypothetical protein
MNDLKEFWDDWILIKHTVINLNTIREKQGLFFGREAEKTGVRTFRRRP